jgi:hypothetical protein
MFPLPTSVAMFGFAELLASAPLAFLVLTPVRVTRLDRNSRKLDNDLSLGRRDQRRTDCTDRNAR